MGKGLAPPHLIFLKLKKHALDNINYENKL